MAIQLKDEFRGRRLISLPDGIRKMISENSMAKLLFATDAGYYPQAQYHYINRPKGASEWILIYCTDGKGWVENGGQTYMLRAGDYFIIPPGSPHRYGADELNPWTIYWVHFTGSTASHFGSGHDRVCEVLTDDFSRIANRLDLFEELFRTLGSNMDEGHMEYASTVLFHFLGSFKYIDVFRDSGNSLSNHGIIEQCKHYMSEHMESKISITDLCQYIGHSPSYCNILFNSYTGMSPKQYLQDLRIKTAAHLLASSDIKVNQVCFKVGINDPYYFSRLFSKIMGIPPSEYKKTANV